MIWAKKHSKQYAIQQLGSNWFSTLGRVRWGFLLFLILFCVHFAQAQNTGSVPYLDSQHTYRVTVGDNNNAHIWVLADENHIPQDTIDVSDVIVTSIDPATSPGDNEDITIFFLNSYFNADTTIYLQYYEYAEFEGGTVECVAAREMPISLIANTFYFDMPDDITDLCNSQSGLVHTYESMDNEKFQTTIDFELTMNKASDFIIAGWNFDVIINRDSSHYSSTILYSASADAGGGTTTITDIGGGYGVANDGNFRVNVTAPTNDNDTQVVVTISVTVEGEAFYGEGVRLVVSNGQATTSSTPPVYTGDNELDYPGRVQGIRVLSIPLASNITIAD